MDTADQQRHQSGNGEIQAGQKLPGAKIRITPVPQWYEGPPFPHVVLSDMPIHVYYERADESGGEWPPAPVAYGPRREAGKGYATSCTAAFGDWSSARRPSLKTE
ncbi:hypothetical protein SHKM778_94530 (plasmid) [Streptomyces sp. KM77-8]|uniref:Uncharacterized protein n=1 Tax=Streptomyces haneummycinicus TaxID=3074435 RepID=A0AAT9HZI8_9ACTN